MKKVIVLLDNKQNKKNTLWKDFFLSIKEIEISFIFWDENEGIFTKDGQEVDLWNSVLDVNGVVNLISKDSEIYNDITLNLEKLNLLFLQNSLAISRVFNNFLRTKSLLNKQGFKTLVDKKIKEGDSPEEIFSNFVLPARILSDDGVYLSRALGNIEQIKDFFQGELGGNSLVIEEYVGDHKMGCFVFLNQDKELKVYTENISGWVSEKENKIEKEAVEIFEFIKPERYMLLEFTIRENNRMIYITDVLVDFDMFLSKKEIMDNIKKEHNIDDTSLLLNIYNQ